MQTIKIKTYSEVPKSYTGVAEYNNVLKNWYFNGKIYDNGHVEELTNGTRQWFLNGQCHREDGPAIEWPDGSSKWFLNDKLHREDGPAVEYATGYKVWCLNGKLLFCLELESQPFILLEEFVDEKGKRKIKVLTQNGIEIWPVLPGLRELADNWKKK
jgi:hypothetical protein